MNTTKTRLLAAALAAALAFLPAADAFARGGFRGGGFRSAPSIRSFSAPKASSWGSATRPVLKASPSASASSTPRLGNFGSPGILGGNRSSASSGRGLYDSARRNGTLFSSKAEAAQSFKSSYAKDYGSTFASEPASRPAYIPNSALVGGNNVNIVYNQGLGGYGYFNSGLGTWMLFDALSDAAMLDHAMSSRGYYWGGAPAYVSHPPSFLGFALAILILFIVGAAIARSVARRRGEREEY